MNISTYIWGYLNNGYSQYPNDYSQSVFQNFQNNATAPTQIVIHRNDNLIYYGYIRKLKFEQYIGVCVVLNGLMLTNFTAMFAIFEDIIASLVVKGDILQFDDDGEIISKVQNLYTNQYEIIRITDLLRSEFVKLEDSSKPLPPINYGISRSEKKCFSNESDEEDIIEASTIYSYTYIYKKEDFDEQSLSHYSSVLKRINNENTSLKIENTKLQAQNKTILRQKKQFKNVIFLILAIIGCGIGLFVLRNNLNIAKGELDEANNTISNKNDSIKNKDNIISDLYQNISNLNTQLREEKEQREEIEEQYEQIKEQYEQIENEYDSFKSLLSSRIPILITNIDIANVDNNGTIETGYGNRIYSSNSMYLRPRITYTGINTEKNITLYLRLYNSSGTLCAGQSSPNGYTFSSNMTVMSGENNTCSFSGWGNSNKGYWSSGSYRYEIWYGNVCLGSKSFSIY